MRFWTAVSISIGVIATKATLTWLALNALVSDLDHPAPHKARHWHIELGPVAEWLAAIAATAAAIVALHIAGRDRKHRIEERRDAEEAQARLVRTGASQPNNSRPCVTVSVENFGSLPVLDVELVEASWSEHPDARWVTRWTTNSAPGVPPTARDNLHRRILKPQTETNSNAYDALIEYGIYFLDPDIDRPLQTVVQPPDGYSYLLYEPIDLSKVTVKIQFTTANGVRWETSTVGKGSGDPVRCKGRLGQPPTGM